MLLFLLTLQKRSLRIQRWSCQSRNIELSALQLYSDPLSGPDMGFHNFPFMGEIFYTDHFLELKHTNPSLAYRLTHVAITLSYKAVTITDEKTLVLLELYRRADRNLPFEHLKLDQKQRYSYVDC